MWDLQSSFLYSEIFSHMSFEVNACSEIRYCMSSVDNISIFPTVFDAVKLFLESYIEEPSLIDAYLSFSSVTLSSVLQLSHYRDLR